MKKQHKKMVETRRLYRFESTYLNAGSYRFTSKERSEAYLRRFAARVWEKYGRKRCRCPDVEVVDGLDISYCSGFTDIKLATSKGTRGNAPHNTVETLLHELTHALGHGDHGRGFARRYYQLLVEFGKCDPGKLRLDMGMAGIKV